MVWLVKDLSGRCNSFRMWSAQLLKPSVERSYDSGIIVLVTANLLIMQPSFFHCVHWIYPCRIVRRIRGRHCKTSRVQMVVCIQNIPYALKSGRLWLLLTWFLFFVVYLATLSKGASIDSRRFFSFTIFSLWAAINSNLQFLQNSSVKTVDDCLSLTTFIYIFISGFTGWWT